MKKIKSYYILIIVAILFGGFVLLGASTAKALVKEVQVTIDGKTYFYSTIQERVEDFLKEKGINITNDDYINIPLTAPLKNQTQIIIKKAYEVFVFDNDKKTSVMVTFATVDDVLKKINVKLNKDDKINFPLSYVLKPGDAIKITRVKEEYITEMQKIAIPVEKRLNYRMDFGKQKVVSNGSEGLLQKKYKLVYENGKIVSKELVESKVVKKPQPKIIDVGTVRWFTTSRGEVVRYRTVYTMTATAYELSPKDTGKSPSHPDYAKTATGHKVQRGVVAVDPRVIPLGTRLYVEGYGFARALDTGSAIKGYKIDLFVEKNAAKYGRRKVKVYVLAD